MGESLLNVFNSNFFQEEMKMCDPQWQATTGPVYLEEGDFRLIREDGEMVFQKTSEAEPIWEPLLRLNPEWFDVSDPMLEEIMGLFLKYQRA